MYLDDEAAIGIYSSLWRLAHLGKAGRQTTEVLSS